MLKHAASSALNFKNSKDSKARVCKQKPMMDKVQSLFDRCIVESGMKYMYTIVSSEFRFV